MATWQVDLVLVSRAALTAGRGESARVTEHELEQLSIWEGVNTEDVLARFAAWLPGRLMTPGWSMFGPEDGNRVDVIFSGARIEELRVRLDARHVNGQFLDRLCQEAQRLNAVLVTSEFHICEPNVAALVVELELSEAGQYTFNPEQHLDHLSRRNDDNGPPPSGDEL